jgi:hypothetical protein
MTIFLCPRPSAALERTLLLLVTTLLLSACSGGSGEAVQPNLPPDDNGTGGGFVYQGPAPQTDDVQNFKLNVYDKLAGEDRCGACHVEGGQAPQIVHHGDVNLAYAAANDLVDLGSPALSRLVTKVAEGHNCWEPEASVCGSIVTNWIEAWANASGAEANVVALTAPPEKTVGSSKSFPAESGDFARLIHEPLLVPYCSQCHSESAAAPQQPYFASADVDAAYQAARGSINLDEPGLSRFVTRLREEAHNCWSDCDGNGTAMQTALQAFSDGITLTAVDPDWVLSRSLGLPDGIVASSGGRVDSHAIALYEFRTGAGSVVYDTSGVEPALHLTLSGDASWVGAWGIRLNGGKAQGSTRDSAKLHKLITATGEYSVEAWVVPDNVTQDGPARIVSYSGGNDARNFTLGQTLYNYDHLNRSAVTDANGQPALSTPDAQEVLQATLQHVVVTYHPVSGRSIYVNGVSVAGTDPLGGGSLQDWDETFALVLGQETSGQDVWRGTVRLLAIHNRALSPEHIQMNFEAGVGQKFYLLFGVSHLIDVPEAYIVMQVEQFDDYSYLFTNPFFVSLDRNAAPDAIPLQGVRIGINGREAAVGQAFANLDVSVGGAAYQPGSGQSLSQLGAVIALQQGAEQDAFFLSFDRLGDTTYSRTAPGRSVEPVPTDLPPQAAIGVRTFEAVNASLSTVTEVPRTRVDRVYQAVQQQLPSVEKLEGFLAAHQAGVMQLAVAYCTNLVQDTELRTTYFPGFDFSQAPASAFDAEGRQQIVQPLLAHLAAHSFSYQGSDTSLASQPVPADVAAILDTLIDAMSDGCGCGADTETAVIATCAATVGSAAMLLQ